MSIHITDTVLDGNLGEGWTDNYAAAREYASCLEAAYRAEFGEDADISIDVRARTSGATPAPRYWDDSEDAPRWSFDADPEQRMWEIRQSVWEDLCSNPPAELIASRTLVELVNPVSGATVERDITDLTQRDLDAYAQLMDDDVRERLHDRLAPCSPAEFLAAYVAEVGPEAAGALILGS